jgi:FAD/FMN-containing dehydrogenase
VHQPPGGFSVAQGERVVADDAWRLRKAKTPIKLLALAPERRSGAHDARPAVIARCADASDVRHAVGFARSEGLDVAERGGSHSIPGFSTVEGGIVIDLSPMKGIEVDVDAATVRAEGG